MTTPERIAICQAMADQAQRWARSLEIMHAELCEMRDEMSALLAVPMPDDRQLHLEERAQ